MDKNQTINFRISGDEKEKFTQDAAEYGMNLSAYILYLLRHKKIQVIVDGKRLANELHDLHMTLNQFANIPELPVHELREVISQGVERIQNFREETENDHLEI